MRRRAQLGPRGDADAPAVSSGESSGVAMVQAADLGHGDHVAHRGRLDRPRIRAVIVE